MSPLPTSTHRWLPPRIPWCCSPLSCTKFRSAKQTLSPGMSAAIRSKRNHGRIGPGSSPRPSSVKASSTARSRELSASAIGVLPVTGLTAHYRLVYALRKAPNGVNVRFSAAGCWTERRSHRRYRITRADVINPASRPRWSANGAVSTDVTCRWNRSTPQRAAAPIRRPVEVAEHGAMPYGIVGEPRHSAPDLRTRLRHVVALRPQKRRSDDEVALSCAHRCRPCG